MKPVISKHIHSCFAAVAGGDIWLYRVIDNIAPKDVNKHVKKFGIISETMLDEVADILTVYIEADKTFYNKGLHAGGMPHYDNTLEFKALIAQYKNDGWGKEPNDVKEADKAKQQRDEAVITIRRKMIGYVFPSYEIQKSEGNYKGGFSDKLVNYPRLKAEALERSHRE